jgi:hypothetical protein
VTAPSIKRPIAPPAYKPQSRQKVAQAKAVATVKAAVSVQSIKRPVAPPVFRPNTKPVAAQAKMAGAAQVKTHPVASAHKPPIAQSKKAVAGRSASQPITSPVHRPHEKLLAVQRKAAVSARIVQQPLAPPAYKPTRPSVQAKMAGSSQLSNQLIAPRWYRPQHCPKVLQTKKSYGQQKIQEQNGQKPYPATIDHPHARASPSQATPIRIQRIPVAHRREAPVNSKSWQQGRVTRGRATANVLQRSAAPTMRSDIKEKQILVAGSKELNELYKVTASLFGYDWDEATDQEKKEIILMVTNLQSAERAKKPPNKGAGNPALVDFTYKGETKKGLDPGGAYYDKLTITYSGTRTQDFLYADNALIKKGGIRPANTVWHHYHDYNPVSNQGTMYLMSLTDHSPTHFGGMWMYNKK